MILRVPITGKLISYDPKTKVGIGSNDNPIRPLDFEKLFPGCDFKWTAVAYDYEGGTALVEITFAKKITVTEWDNTKEPPEPLAWKTETDLEFFTRQADFNRLAWDKLIARSSKELYELTEESKVEMP